VNWAELELAEWFIDFNPCPLYPLFSLSSSCTHAVRCPKSQSVYVRINNPCFIIFALKSFPLYDRLRHSSHNCEKLSFSFKRLTISNSMQHLVLQFRFNFRWFLCVKYLSKCHRFVYNYKIHIFTWNAPKTTGFLFIHINLHPVLNIVIDSVLVSSFDLWFRILEYRYIFRLDRGGRYIKGVARFAWAKLALAG